MFFNKVRDLKYSKEDKTTIDLLGTCEEYGEIPMTLNIVDTEDNHFFIIDNNKDNAIPLEEYCKTLQIAPYVEPEIVVIIPNSVTKLQAKLQLLEIGLLDEVEALTEQDRKAKLYWTDSQNFLRTDEILLGMATALGLNDEQLDNLFLEASKR